MKCIDFDKAFSMYAMKYFREHAKEYKNYDAMEAAMPDVYARFLDTPADFLANLKECRAKRGNIDISLVQSLMRERQTARQIKDFAASDQLRDRLAAMGVEVRDTPLGAVWDIL